jgi:hypothetical protein
LDFRSQILSESKLWPLTKMTLKLFLYLFKGSHVLIDENLKKKEYFFFYELQEKQHIVYILRRLYQSYIYIVSRHHSRFFDCLVHPNLCATLPTDQKWPLSHLRISYQSLVPLTIVLISGISTMVNGTLLNFGKRY